VCEDVNECDDPEACGDHSNCTNMPGFYTCECVEGYAKKGKVCTGEFTELKLISLKENKYFQSAKKLSAFAARIYVIST